MSNDLFPQDFRAEAFFCVPGTCFPTCPPLARRPAKGDGSVARDLASRQRYLREALAQVPRLLGAIDRNPYRPTYGCLDRQYWHYRTSSFPSQMYQEGVLPLALIHATDLPGNRWFGNERVRELAIAGIRFAARSSHADGSCDDYYPFERALGAAVFSLQATARAYQVLGLNDPELLTWLRRRADWLIRHDESGRLANHQALAALGLLRVAQITGEEEYFNTAQARINRVLDWQSKEGWFEEYGGADPGYQTVTIDCLAKCRQLVDDDRLDVPLKRAVAFARLFLHPDHSYAGEYGSRGTYHFYPHGMELLAGHDPAAADLADGFLASLKAGTVAHFDDDRMVTHRVGNLIEAYIDWAPTRPEPATFQDDNSLSYLPHARLLVRRANLGHTVISAARGGAFKHFGPGQAAVTDTGLIVETTTGRIAASQWHDTTRQVGFSDGTAGLDPHHDAAESLCVIGQLHWCRFETATPLGQSLLHAGMWSVGRWCRSVVRRLLQRRLITHPRPYPIRLTRSFDFLPEWEVQGGPSLRITDTIELTDPSINVRRMGFSADLQASYVAASDVYQQSVLAPSTDLDQYVGELNARRRVTVVREL